MAQSKQVYKNPQAGQPLITTISTGCKTPLLDVKFCNLVNPYYYANSPTIPRYSITCILDPELELHKEFLKGIQTIEKNEKVDSIIKNDTVKKEKEYVTTGKLLIKFQSKDKIPVHSIIESVVDNTTIIHDPVPIELEDELAKGEQIIVFYDILRYTKKNTMNVEHGLSFKPSSIYYYPRTNENGKS